MNMGSHPYKRKYVKGAHPRAEHIVVAEKALGKRLPKGSQVHHINYDKRDNRNGNLVICQNAKYHKLLHLRTDAYNATGDPNLRKCIFCKEYDSLDNMSCVQRSTGIDLVYHKPCNTKAATEYRGRVMGT